VNQPRAHTALQAAHQGDYRFPANGAGFAADLQVARDSVAQTGRVTPRSPREIDIDFTADEETPSEHTLLSGTTLRFQVADVRDTVKATVIREDHACRVSPCVLNAETIREAKA
jgi:hypothetical protein